MTSQENPQAFPSSGVLQSEGMSLRDYFAAKAMQAIISNSEIAASAEEAKRGMTQEQIDEFDKVVIPKVTALASYNIADAMLAERQRKTHED